MTDSLTNIYKQSEAVFLVTDDSTYITDEDAIIYLVVKDYDTSTKVARNIATLKNINK